MESLSPIFARSTRAREASRPDPVTCACGAAVQPAWLLYPRPHWESPDVCETCTEAAARTEQEAERAKREAQDAAARAVRTANALAAIAPTPRAQDMLFATFRTGTRSQTEALDITRSGASVWLYGNPGVGKTHLATAAAIEAAHQDVPAERWLVADLMAVLRAQALTGEAERTVERMRTVDLLVLDDLGVERPTPFACECLYRIIDARYEESLRTIVTSNGAPSEVAKAVGARIHSRLIGMCRVVKMDGPDARKEGAR